MFKAFLRKSKENGLLFTVLRFDLPLIILPQLIDYLHTSTTYEQIYCSRMDHPSHHQRFSREDVDKSKDYLQEWKDTDTSGTNMKAVTQQTYLQPSTDVRFAGHNYDSPAWEQPQYPSYHQNWPSMYPSQGRPNVLIGGPGSEAGYPSSYGDQGDFASSQGEAGSANPMMGWSYPQISNEQDILAHPSPSTGDQSNHHEQFRDRYHPYLQRSGNTSASSSQTPPSEKRRLGRPSGSTSTSDQPRKKRKKSFLSPKMENVIKTGRKVMGATLEAFRASNAATPKVWSTPTRRGKTFKEIRGDKGLPGTTAKELYMAQWTCQLTLTFASTGAVDTRTGTGPRADETVEFRQVTIIDHISSNQCQPSNTITKRKDDSLYQKFKAEYSPLQQPGVPFVYFEEHRDRYDVQVTCTALMQYGVLPATISVFLDVEPMNSSECLDQDDEP
ncbi:hypothetical protein V866_002297 [Kwoniella sp. B9012]